MSEEGACRRISSWYTKTLGKSLRIVSTTRWNITEEFFIPFIWEVVRFEIGLLLSLSGMSVQFDLPARVHQIQLCVHARVSHARKYRLGRRHWVGIAGNGSVDVHVEIRAHSQ